MTSNHTFANNKWRTTMLITMLLFIAVFAGCADDTEENPENSEPVTGNVVDVYAETNPTPTPAPDFIIHGLVTPNPEVSWESVYTPPTDSAVQAQATNPDGCPAEPVDSPPTATATPTSKPKPSATQKVTTTPKPTAAPTPTPGGGPSMLMPSSGGNIVYVSPTPAASEQPSSNPAATPTDAPTATPSPEPTPTPNPIKGTGSKHSFTATSVDGRSIDSESLFAKADITMINLWGTHCGPCISEMPDLARLNDDYSGKGVQVVGIVCDVNGKDSQLVDSARNIISQTGADYLHLMVSDSLKSDLLSNVSVVPVTIFVDSEGRYLRDRVVGARSYDNWKDCLDEILDMAAPDPTPTPYVPRYSSGSS